MRSCSQFTQKIIIIALMMHAAIVWRDGDIVALQWRWWHPVGLCAIIWFIVAGTFVLGIPGLIKHRDSVGIGMSDWWRERKDERDFLRFTRNGLFFDSELKARTPR